MILLNFQQNNYTERSSWLLEYQHFFTALLIMYLSFPYNYFDDLKLFSDLNIIFG